MNLPRKFRDYASAYSSFGDIPEERKLSNYEDDFVGVNVWGMYLEDKYSDADCSQAHRRDIERVGDEWKEICLGNCHHALTPPQLVDQWCKVLVIRMSATSARMNYVTHLNQFYRYLMWNVEYPHSYNPVQFAIDRYDTAREVWTSHPWE